MKVEEVRGGRLISVRRDERGAAIVEFAVLLPLLLLFMFGIIEYGRAYNARIELTSAVREGARAVALGRDGVAATKNGAPALDPSKIIVTAPSTCPAGSNSVVKATYPLSYDLPLFRSGTWTLTATGVMRCGG